jgi:hypothetical protein
MANQRNQQTKRKSGLEDETQEWESTPIDEFSLEELEEQISEQRRAYELDEDGPVDTQHSDGSAYDGYIAQQQGLVYTPPDDPPILPSDDLQGAEIASGFGRAMEEADSLLSEDFPERFAERDEHLAEQIRTALRINGETTQHDAIEVEVAEGIVYLKGDVETLDDVDVILTVVRDVPGVVDIEEELRVELI